MTHIYMTNGDVISVENVVHYIESKESGNIRLYAEDNGNKRLVGIIHRSGIVVTHDTGNHYRHEKTNPNNPITK